MQAMAARDLDYSTNVLLINVENLKLFGSWSVQMESAGRKKRIKKNLLPYWLTKTVFGIKYSPLEKKPKWRNWQTRYVQGVVRVPSCGFKSHLRHTEDSLQGGFFV